MAKIEPCDLVWEASRILLVVGDFGPAARLQLDQAAASNDIGMVPIILHDRDLPPKIGKRQEAMLQNKIKQYLWLSAITPRIIL